MEISKRLSRMTSLLPCGEVAADIGCDHAYAAIRLIEIGKYKKVIASDVRKGPLESARKNIAMHGLTEQIETRLYDGLQGLAPGEADGILIGGMGGATMRMILEAGQEVVRKAKNLLLQPQSELSAFRKYLRENGCQVVEEDIVYEDGKYYPMMLVFPGMEKDFTEQPVFDAFGKLLLEKKHPVLKEYLLQQISVKEKIIERLQKADANERIQRQLAETKRDLRYIQEAMDFYK
ncbi:MAG: class I SAM-dependent methyltransferase [Lachnospiraceae bacterium]|nr:class I SAM-dependent methyltransferase [Lachnospiraceae bacterium]